MAAGTVTMAQCRQEVLRQLYAHHDIILGTASDGSTTTIKDAGTTDKVTLESALNSTDNYVGIWVYVPGVAAPQTSRVASYDIDDGLLTLTTALGATASGEAYELHYELAPARVNTMIQNRARQMSHGALTTIAESTAVPLDKFTLASGVLADCYRAIAIGKRGQEQTEYLEMANMYEAFFLSGTRLEGYENTYRDPLNISELDALTPRI